MSEKQFDQYLKGKEDEWYEVIFPYPNLREHLHIPAEGTLKEIVNHLKGLAKVIGQVGFQWEVHIDDIKKEVVIKENKSQAKYIDDPIDLLCQGEKND